MYVIWQSTTSWKSINEPRKKRKVLASAEYEKLRKMSRVRLEKELEKRMKKRSKTSNSNDNQTNMASLNLKQFHQYKSWKRGP